MLDLPEAQALLLGSIQPLGQETIPLFQAPGRILAESIVASASLPRFDNSAMDGYAVRAVDLRNTTPERPTALQLVGRITAGETFSGELSSGECVRLFTGSPLPQGADAVVMQEDTRLDGSNLDRVLVLEGVKPWENVRLKGEDIKPGVALFQSGNSLTIPQAGLLAALGTVQVTVGRRPRVGLLATGSELREAGEPLEPSQIYESNRICLAALAKRAGAETTLYPLVRDTLEATEFALGTALAECDAVITSGGVSVGETDFVKAAFEKLGGTLAFWRVAIKPGKPFAFGHSENKPLFGLPGNPVSAFVTFLLLVRPALLKLQGALDTRLPTSPGFLSEPLVNRGDRRHFVRVTLDRNGEVRLAGAQASHLLHSLAAAQGLLEMPPQSTMPAGTMVPVLRWD